MTLCEVLLMEIECTLCVVCVCKKEASPLPKLAQNERAYVFFFVVEKCRRPGVYQLIHFENK